MKSESTYEMACVFKLETEAAILITDPASGEDIWIPFSQVEEIHRAPDGTGTIVMTSWIARQKGLL